MLTQFDFAKEGCGADSTSLLLLTLARMNSRYLKKASDAASTDSEPHSTVSLCSDMAAVDRPERKKQEHQSKWNRNKADSPGGIKGKDWRPNERTPVSAPRATSSKKPPQTETQGIGRN